MTSIFEHTITVSLDEIDELGHANNVAYFYWLQAAAVAHSAAQGWPGERYRSSGFVWVARSHEITYLDPARGGQQLTIRTWVADMKRASSLRRYEVWNGTDARLATASTRWALVDLTTRKPRRIPPELAQSFDVVDLV